MSEVLVTVGVTLAAVGVASGLFALFAPDKVISALDGMPLRGLVLMVGALAALVGFVVATVGGIV